MSEASDGRRTTVDHTHRRDVYSAIGRVEEMVQCDTEYLACAEPLRRAGLSAAADTLVILYLWPNYCISFDLVKLGTSNLMCRLILGELVHA